MAAASATAPEHNTTAGRRRLPSHLHVQVPVPTSSGWSGRSSGPASAPCFDAHANAAAAHHHQHRPASPSLLRSPTAWIRSKGHSFGSDKHTPRRYGNFHYDARSYALNFDEGGSEEDDDALKHRYLSPGLLASPPSNQGTSGGGGAGGRSNSEEPTRVTLGVMQ